MEKNVVYVGLDVDDKNFTGSVIMMDSGESFGFRLKAQTSRLVKKLKEFVDKGYEVKLCYEATYIGFSLKRELDKVDGVECEVISPSQIPTLASDRVKTDRLDSERLAKYYANGMLTVVRSPSAEDEDERRILRTRASLKEDSKNIKKKILSLCRSMGLNYRQLTGGKSYWTTIHLRWLNGLVKSKDLDYGFKKSLESYIFMLNNYEQTIEDLENDIEKMSQQEKYKAQVDALVCMRGISTLSAMTLISEIGDINRFNHPNKLVSYSGLDISEYSSGGKVNKFGITKMGNKRIRTVLVEASQSANKPVVISKTLKVRRVGKPLEYVELGNRCMKRLRKKASKMLLIRT